MKKSNLNSKARLKQTPLRAKKTLKRGKPIARKPSKPKRRLKLEEKSAQQLIKEADKPFSRYVRLRDSERKGSEWFGRCVTCSHSGLVAYIDENNDLRFVNGWDAGHFISRGNKYLRYNEENVNLQCKFHCNKMKSGNIEKYKPALDAKYGDGTWQKLSRIAQENPIYSLRKPELLEIIHSFKEAVVYIENQA